jgi:hypothetical protein
MTDAMRMHLEQSHGRWCGELVGLDDEALAGLHELDHYEAELGLTTACRHAASA